jgi:hypothetical protein
VDWPGRHADLEAAAYWGTTLRTLDAVLAELFGERTGHTHGQPNRRSDEVDQCRKAPAIGPHQVRQLLASQTIGGPVRR